MIGTSAPPKASIILISAGLKHPPLPKADLYLDCRAIANPFHEASLAGLTGDDPKVQAWVRTHSPRALESFLMQVTEALDRIPARRKGESNPFARPVTVCCMCAHGVHRSRSVKNILAQYLPKQLDLREVTVT